ncbi:MAG TPA: methyltransferase domain-containing protein [Panacibacter sp.]|nr:methyltransferase domain-containing protein [Panacibacter sp.]
MSNFEKEYYESPDFWDNGMIEDHANIERIKKTAQLIPDDVHSLVDIGCGNGVFLNYLINLRPTLDLTGIERSAAALKHVKTKKSIGDISNLSFLDRSIDCVTCLEVIEHLPLPIYKHSLNELARVADKYIIVSVPYNEKLENSYTKCPSCKSIFNSDLHLRSFIDRDIFSLFDDYGFKNIAIEKLGEISEFKGHEQYRKIFYPEQILSWNSPICPICGFVTSKNREQNILVQNKQLSKRSFISYFSALPKMIWPKDKRYYWIIGVYMRIS